MPPPRDTQRIAKLLARAGIASRREVERMIAEGRIAIGGKLVDTPATLLTSLHGVTVDGKPVKAATPARLFRYHKPAGLLTAERDPQGRPTIYDRLPKDLPRLMPVGRLDMNTEGLLLLTTDGELKRQLELPATGVERSYRARAFGTVSQQQLEELIEGVEIEGMRYGPIDANLERRTGRNQWIELQLREGKNREVRRVLEHLDLKVSRLIRTAYGPFALEDLPPGAVDEVRQHDVVAFRKWMSTPGGTTAFAPRSRATAPDGESRAPQSRTSPAGPAPARRSASPGTKRDERRGSNTDAERRPRTSPAGPAPARPSASPGTKRDERRGSNTDAERRPRTSPAGPAPARPSASPGTKRDERRGTNTDADRRPRTSPAGPAPARRSASPGTKRDERRGPNTDADRRPARTGAKPGPKRQHSAPAVGAPAERQRPRGPGGAGPGARRTSRPPRKPGPGRK